MYLVDFTVPTRQHELNCRRRHGKFSVRRATGKNLTNHLPNPRLVTLSPLETVGSLIFVWGRT